MKLPFGLFGRRPAQTNALQALSMLTPEHYRKIGSLPAVTICGYFEGEARSEANFRPNEAFVDVLHAVIAAAGPRDPELVAAALAQGQGYVYLIDRRTPGGADGDVSPEDILGSFRVEDGRIVAGGYAPFARHKLFSRNGQFRLPHPLHSALLEALMAAR